jgi:hypothetical protein
VSLQAACAETTRQCLHDFSPKIVPIASVQKTLAKLLNHGQTPMRKEGMVSPSPDCFPASDTVFI